MKHIFDFLRKISGGKLTQKQVDAADKLIATAYDDLNDMLGIATDEMHISPSGINLICNFEGKRLTAYDDGVGVWTIGFGTTVYPNGIKVMKGDTCTEAQAKTYMAQQSQCNLIKISLMLWFHLPTTLGLMHLANRRWLKS